MATSLINNARARGLFYQALLVGALAALIGVGWRNAVVNMEARGIPIGFGFWDQTAGFAINQSMIEYSALSTYGRCIQGRTPALLLVSALSESRWRRRWASRSGSPGCRPTGFSRRSR